MELSPDEIRSALGLVAAFARDDADAANAVMDHFDEPFELAMALGALAYMTIGELARTNGTSPLDEVRRLSHRLELRKPL